MRKNVTRKERKTLFDVRKGYSPFYEKVFKCGRSEVCRCDLESLPCPFDTSKVSNDTMRKVVRATEAGTMDRTSEYSREIPKDRISEIWWEELEAACN